MADKDKYTKVNNEQSSDSDSEENDLSNLKN